MCAGASALPGLKSPDERRRVSHRHASRSIVVAVVTRTPMLLPMRARRHSRRCVRCGALFRARLRVTLPWAVWTPVDRAAAAIAVYGALLPVIPEFVFLRDAFDNRMNTMFKVDYQAWVLLMLAGAYGIVTLVRTVRADEGRVSDGRIIAAHGSLTTRIGVTVFAVMAITIRCSSRSNGPATSARRGSISAGPPRGGRGWTASSTSHRRTRMSTPH